eukprot:EG_transcript_5626
MDDAGGPSAAAPLPCRAMFRPLVCLGWPLLVIALLTAAEDRRTPSPAYSVILTADPGTYSGYPEATFILDAMARVANVSETLPFCAVAYDGLLNGHRVLAVTTGIGIMQASTCMENVLQEYSARIARIFFLGTSGWSPAEGGLISASTCSARDGIVNRIGDVCVSAASTNWDCHFCDWRAVNNATACQLPPCHGHGRPEVFGPCSPQGNSDLAARVAAQAASIQFPDMSPALARFVHSYWDVTSKGTGVQYAVPRTPKVLGPGRCAEATSSTLWSGLPNEMLCRQYLGELVADVVRGNNQPHTTSSRSLTSPVDVVTCVSAMEAAGWMPVLLRWQAMRPGRFIPFVNIRAASNYVHRPLMLNRQTADWRELDWLPEDQYAQFTVEGYRYGILTASRVVLRFFQSAP